MLCVASEPDRPALSSSAQAFVMDLLTRLFAPSAPITVKLAGMRLLPHLIRGYAAASSVPYFRGITSCALSPVAASALAVFNVRTQQFGTRLFRAPQSLLRLIRVILLPLPLLLVLLFSAVPTTATFAAAATAAAATVTTTLTYEPAYLLVGPISIGGCIGFCLRGCNLSFAAYIRWHSPA